MLVRRLVGLARLSRFWARRVEIGDGIGSDHSAMRARTGIPFSGMIRVFEPGGGRFEALVEIDDGVAGNQVVRMAARNLGAGLGVAEAAGATREFFEAGPESAGDLEIGCGSAGGRLRKLISMEAAATLSVGIDASREKTLPFR